MGPDVWTELRGALPWLGGFLVALVTYIATWRRGEVIDDEQERWRDALQAARDAACAERDAAKAESWRWQRHSRRLEVAVDRLQTEWDAWAQTMEDIVRRGGLKPDERVPLRPNKASVVWPDPPNGDNK